MLCIELHEAPSSIRLALLAPELRVGTPCPALPHRITQYVASWAELQTTSVKMGGW